MTSSGDIFLQFDSPDGEFAVVIEGDERVTYAYLLRGDDIVGDAWLCNVAATPADVDWDDESQMPFLNPREYCAAGTAPDFSQDVECSWDGEVVEISIGQVLFARLSPGARPGWSRMADQNGPLARCLTDWP